jgi:Mpv17 / PMP22 family
VADILILDSTFVAMTIVLTGVLEGIPNHVLMDQFRTDYFGTLRASWITSALLFPLQFCMFRFLPLRLRVLAVNFLDVIWDAVLSFNAHRSRVFV